MANRRFAPLEQLAYGDYGLSKVVDVVDAAIRAGKRIALYADYDVDGTMSCVSWIWFLRAIGHTNFLHHIPCRFKEGYGLNLKAIERLVEVEKAELVITMDTGITANAEAAYCKKNGVEFICTDHHVIQPDKMPDCVILNPKMHESPEYQELCGCGITFVLLRRLGERYKVPPSLWSDLLALAGMATICDVVPLNGVNHRLAKLGVQHLMKSERPVLKRLREASRTLKGLDEKDVGFRLGPRINAVGRLEHADLVVKAFVDERPDSVGALVQFMDECNEQRKKIQASIVTEARLQATLMPEDPVLVLGGDWHPGVVGIAASKIAEEFWRPVWLFQRKDGVCKGSARTFPGGGFDVTKAMVSCGHLFTKFGGHAAAGGFTFPAEREDEIRDALAAYADDLRQTSPEIWESRIKFDCLLPEDLADLALLDSLDGMKPFGYGFEEPKFCVDVAISRLEFLRDKNTGEPKHTLVTVKGARGKPQKLMFFNEALKDLQGAKRARFVVSAAKDQFRGNTSLMLMGHDFEVVD